MRVYKRFEIVEVRRIVYTTLKKEAGIVIINLESIVPLLS